MRISAASLFNRRKALLSALLVSASGLAVTAAPAMAEVEGYPIIVDGAQFDELVAKGIRIVDTRPAAQFAEGHIPGAVNVPTSLLNVGEVDGIRNEIPADAVLIEVLRAAGLNDGDDLVIVDGPALPGRAFIALEYSGFDNLHVLNGGIASYTGELTTELAQVAPGTFSLSDKNEIRVSQDYVAAKQSEANAIIVDGRSELSFNDGHIPGAISFSAVNFIRADQSEAGRPAILDTLVNKGLTADREIVSYCGSGAAAAINYLSLKNLGYENVVLYDGSWDEWSRDPEAGQQVALGNYSFGEGFSAGAEKGPAFLSQDELALLQTDPNVVVVDVRNTDDYRVGHIPGAVNVYWDDTLDTARVLLDADALRAKYAEAGVTPDKHVVLFTRGGLQLSHSFTVLTLLGFDKIDFFTGKFEGWAV